MPISIRQLPPFAVSLVLHLGVFAVVSYLALKPAVLAPYGVYRKGGPVVVEFEASSNQVSNPVKAARPVLSDDGDVAVQQKKEITKPVQATPAPANTATQLGHADGTATSGLLGDPNGTKQAGAKERYLYELHVLIEGRKVYPVTSRRLRESGKVLVQFTVEQDGTIKDVSVKEGTAFARLNEAARDLIASIRKYKPLPEEFRAADAKLEIPIEYTLQ